MTTLTVKLPAALHARLEAAALRKGRTKSEVARQALEVFLATGGPSKGGGSCLDLARDLAGSVNGPGDLSLSKKHLRRYGK